MAVGYHSAASIGHSTDDDESERYGRSTKSVIKELCAYNPINARTDERLAHNCYFSLIAILNKRMKITTTINEETTEHILEHITFMVSDKELLKQRSHDLVFEDNFNMKIFEKAKADRFSFEKLQEICSKYKTSDGMLQHEELTDIKYEFFTKRGFDEKEARATAFAIAFYTRFKSETINRAGSLLARQGNRAALTQVAKGDVADGSVILYYLVRGLSNIPYYWGTVSRACQLTDDELKCYMPGYLVTWLQFSSSMKGEQPPKHFRKRNTSFLIYSLTGRSILDFSNFQEEDEVLFLPHPTFIVVDHQFSFHGKQHQIFLRQVELGLSQWSVLWVDDHIFDEKWENKKHMETAAARALNFNVHFIPKSNTDNAISFLVSPFGQHLKNKDNLRIVTDMHRDNEYPASTAGARFIKRFDHVKQQEQHKIRKGMASGGVEKNILCVKCGLKGGGIFMCHGCQQSFCWKHTGEHRQELFRQMDILGQDHDLLQKDLSQHSTTNHPLFLEINKWEQASMVQIQVTAEVARADLRKKLQDSKNQLQTSLSNITQELCSSRESDNVSEIDLAKWTERLNKIRQQLQTSLTIRTVFDEKTPFIQMIKIRQEAAIDPEQNKIRVNTPRIETVCCQQPNSRQEVQERAHQSPFSFQYHQLSQHQQHQERRPQSSSVFSGFGQVPQQQPYQDSRPQSSVFSSFGQQVQQKYQEPRPQSSSVFSAFGQRPQQQHYQESRQQPSVYSGFGSQPQRRREPQPKSSLFSAFRQRPQKPQLRRSKSK